MADCAFPLNQLPAALKTHPLADEAVLLSKVGVTVYICVGGGKKEQGEGRSMGL